MLRPASERGTSGVSQDVDATLGAIKPAIDIMQQNLGRIGDFRPEIADTSWPLRQRGRAGRLDPCPDYDGLPAAGTGLRVRAVARATTCP